MSLTMMQELVAAPRAAATLLPIMAVVFVAFLVVGIAMLLVGFGFKVSAVPFHMWAPDVYDGSPNPITAYMAATVKTAAFAAFLRVWLEAFPSTFEHWHRAVVGLAIATMVIGNAQNIPTRLFDQGQTIASKIATTFNEASIGLQTSALIYLGSLWHGGGANTSATMRLGVVLHYAVAWLRPVENHVLVVPPAQV